MQLKEYIDDTEDLINIKLVRNKQLCLCFLTFKLGWIDYFILIAFAPCNQGNIQNQLIKFELLLTAATFVTTIFAVITGIFGMNFETSVFDIASRFNWVLIITGVSCVAIYICFLLYFRHKKIFPL